MLQFDIVGYKAIGAKVEHLACHEETEHDTVGDREVPKLSKA
jgi:hypothetical protein